eukprot:746135-Hanusia_phi.AAC.1
MAKGILAHVEIIYRFLKSFVHRLSFSSSYSASRYFSDISAIEGYIFWQPPPFSFPITTPCFYWYSTEGKSPHPHRLTTGKGSAENHPPSR